MDPMSEEQLDYGEDENGGSQKSQFHGSGAAIPALAEGELMGEEDEYDDLYNDVNVGDGFTQTLQQRSESLAASGNSGLTSQKSDVPGVAITDPAPSQGVSIPGVGVQKRDPRANTDFPKAEQPKSEFMPNKSLEGGLGGYPDGFSQKGNRALDMAPQPHTENVGFQGRPPAPVPLKISMDPTLASGPSMLPPESGSGSIRSGPSMTVNQTGVVGARPVTPVMHDTSMPAMGSVDSNGPTMLFVGALHWWTTDADLERALSQYGRVKEIKIFDERASGKSKGYCQVEFFDPAGAAACKEGMNGHMFNGRACVVEFASSQTLKQMGAGYMKRNQIQGQSQPQGRGMMNDGTGNGGFMNNQGGDGGRNYGKGGWARGGQGMVNRGQGGAGPMRGRGAIGPRGMVSGSGVSGGHYGQGLAGPGFGGPAGALMHPQNMMGTGFDPTYMGRGGPYGGFQAPAFPGMMPSFPAVNAVGLPGVAPHVNPAFFGRGMLANGMGMMGNSGMEGQAGAMWADTGMGWMGEEQGRRTRESSYGGDGMASDYGSGEATRERGRSNASREKERSSERDWSGKTERRHRDDREQDREKSDRDRYREEKDSYRDQRQRGRDYKDEDDWDRGQSSSRSGSKSRTMQDGDHRSRSKDGDYGKRRRD